MKVTAKVADAMIQRIKADVPDVEGRYRDNGHTLTVTRPGYVYEGKTAEFYLIRFHTDAADGYMGTLIIGPRGMNELIDKLRAMTPAPKETDSDGSAD